jgi:hypothetical protein
MFFAILVVLVVAAGILYWYLKDYVRATRWSPHAVKLNPFLCFFFFFFAQLATGALKKSAIGVRSAAHFDCDALTHRDCTLVPEQDSARAREVHSAAALVDCGGAQDQAQSARRRRQVV